MGVFVLVCFHSFEERVQSQRREVLASIYYSEGLNYIMRNSTCPFTICLKTAGGIVWEQNMQYESCAHHLLPCTLPLRRMSRRGTTYLLKKKKKREKKEEQYAQNPGMFKKIILEAMLSSSLIIYTMQGIQVLIAVRNHYLLNGKETA